MKTFVKFTLSTIFCLIGTTLVHAGPLDNCSEYTKMGIPGDQGTPLCRKGYALAHNAELKTPMWVAEHLTKDKANAHMMRKNYFAPDPVLPAGDRAELADYKKSGFDRGHMAPAGDMQWDKEAYVESFYLSNIVPQVGPRMNRGIWKVLEEHVRDWAITRGELYVYTGPVYDEDEIEVIGEHEVGVPTHLYKVIYDPTRKEALAFMMPNQELKTEDMPKYLVSVDLIEKITGLDFLSALDKDVQHRLESKKANGLWKLPVTP